MSGSKDRVFQLRYSDEEAEMLKKVAENKGLAASAWLRMTIREAYDQLQKNKR